MAGRGQDEDAVGEVVGQVLEQVEERRLGPVDVVDDDHDRTVGGKHLEEPASAPEQLGQRELVAGEADGGGQPIDDLGVADQGLDLVERQLGRGVDVDAGSVPDDLAERPEGDALAVGQGAALGARGPRRPGRR